MSGWLKRLVLASGGGLVGALLVALLEARAATTAGAAYGDVAQADFAVLAPVALLVALAVGAFGVYLEPDHARSLREHVGRLRDGGALARTTRAALAPIGIAVALAWCVGSAGLARAALAEGAPPAAGVRLAVGSTALLVALAAMGLALVLPLRRALANATEHHPRLVDPATTTALAAVVGIGLLALGVAMGDTGGGGPTPLAIFGVLKRNELDLRPLVDLGAIALFAHSGAMALGARAQGRHGWGLAAAAATVVAIAAGLVAHEAVAMNAELPVARAIEQGAPLGRVGLALARRATDRDHDAWSPLFAGGDCDDRDKSVSPNGVDVPGNGKDEDCSGEDTPLAVATAPAEAWSPGAPAGTAATIAAPAPKLPADLNLVVITVDTLRPDVGFMGYDRATTPELDKLAARSVVFDRAYSMASYTGKSVAPMMIGKYPSETLRDGGHFNTYFPQNTFVAERLAAAGVRTLGAGTHWYFEKQWGLADGMQDWRIDAIPMDKSQGVEDTSTTSPQLTDLAIKMLSAPENTSGKFFAWFHYFDPHAQYQPHGEAPRFPYGNGVVAAMRAAYDGEIWFTDHAIGRLLDFIASQPWGDKTAIVVTSDHGEAFLEHKQAYHGIEIYEELVRVPLIVYVPGIDAHRVAKKRSQIDLVPTLLDILQVPQPAPGELSGATLMGCIAESAEDDQACPEKDVLIDMPDGPNTKFRRAILHGPTPGTKLIHFGGNRYELYDLAKDPGETTDLSGDKAALENAKAAFEAMKGKLHEIYVKADDPPY